MEGAQVRVPRSKKTPARARRGRSQKGPLARALETGPPPLFQVYSSDHSARFSATTKAPQGKLVPRRAHELRPWVPNGNSPGRGDAGCPILFLERLVKGRIITPFNQFPLRSHPRPTPPRCNGLHPKRERRCWPPNVPDIAIWETRNPGKVTDSPAKGDPASQARTTNRPK